jgi:predicted porin
VVKKSVMLITLLGCSVASHAQSSVTLYGALDQYMAYEKSSSGKSLTALGDGALLRSRFGMTGSEDLGGGYRTIFTLESGINADTGAAADSSRLFDRQAWVGLATPAGQFRIGRQNTIAFYIGDAIDYTSRASLGSIINNFGVPARFDNDISYKSPRFYNFQVDLHYAVPGIAGGGLSHGAVYQLGIDYKNSPFRIGYAGLVANPLGGGIYQNRIQYHNIYADYDYGHGKIYLAYVHSNNVTSNATGNNAVGILSNASVPNNFFAGTNPNVQRFYDVWQVSADYRVSPALVVGALVGIIKDSSDADNEAYGGNIGVNYSLSKMTSLYAFLNYMKNRDDAGFRFSGSGAPPNFSGSDINGRGLIGAQAGILHLF